MEAFHTIAASAALVLLLLAVLRHRQHPIPAPLRVGTFIAPVGELFDIAQMALGPEAIDALLVGDTSANGRSSWLTINDTEVSQIYFVVMQLFNLIAVIGMLLIAIGLLMLVRNVIGSAQARPEPS